VSEMKEILDRLTEMGQDIKGIKADVTDIKADVTDIKADVTELKVDVTELKLDVAGLKADVTELKINVAGLQTRMGNLESSVEQIKTRQEIIFEQTAGLLEFRTETKAILRDIQESQLATSDILGEHEISIRGLRRRLV